MKIITYLILLLTLTNLVSAEVKVTSPKEIHEFIKPILSKGWKSVHDSRSLVIYREKEVRLLNPISLPPGSFEEKLKDFGWNDHLIIKLHFVRKYTDEEYTEIRNLREEKLKRLKENKEISGKTKLGLKWEIEEKFPLPKLYNKQYSIYLHTTDKDMFYVHPETAEKELVLVLNKLKEVLKEYP